jgi:hypothetical protein
VRITLTNTVKALREVAEPTNIEGVNKVMRDSQLGKTLDALVSDLSKRKMTFEGARAMRTFIGKESGKPKGLLEGMDKAQKKIVYGALSRDIESALAAKPEALKAFQRANKFYAAGVKRIETHLERVTNAQSPEAAYAALTRSATDKNGNVRMLHAVKQSLAQDEWRDVSANIIDRMGKSDAGRGDFSPTTFATNYSKMSSNAKEMLFGTKDNPLRASLDDIFVLSRNAERMAKMQNFSNTGTSLETAAGLGTATGVITGTISPVTASIGAMTVSGTGALLTSPRFAKFLARTNRAGPQTRVQLAARTSGFLQSISKKDPIYADVRAFQEALADGENQSSETSPNETQR